MRKLTKKWKDVTFDDESWGGVEPEYQELVYGGDAKWKRRNWAFRRAAGLYFVGLVHFLALLIVSGYALLLFESNPRRSSLNNMLSNSLVPAGGGGFPWLSRISPILNNALHNTEVIVLPILGFRAFAQDDGKGSAIDKAIDKHM